MANFFQKSPGFHLPACLLLLDREVEALLRMGPDAPPDFVLLVL